MFNKMIALSKHMPVQFSCTSAQVFSWRSDIDQAMRAAEDFIGTFFSLSPVSDVILPIKPKRQKVHHALFGLCRYPVASRPKNKDRLKSPASYHARKKEIMLGHHIGHRDVSPAQVFVHEAVHHLDNTGRIPKFSSLYLANGVDIVYALLNQEAVCFGLNDDHGSDMFNKGYAYARWLLEPQNVRPPISPFQLRLMGSMVDNIDLMNKGGYSFRWNRNIGGYYEEHDHGMFYGGINNYLIQKGVPITMVAELTDAMVRQQPLKEVLQKLF